MVFPTPALVFAPAAEVGSNNWDTPKVVEFLEKTAATPAGPTAAAAGAAFAGESGS